VHCCPLSAIPWLLWCLALHLPGGTILLDENSVSRRPDDLAGGDGYSVKLTEARNQSWKPQDPVGILRVHWVSYGCDPCKQ